MIEAEALTRRFGDFVAVDRLSLRVPDGAVLALLGPNGAGKTTTVRMLAGLLAPSGGTARVAGYDIGREPAKVRARVGLVTDTPGLYEQMTLPSYLDFYGGIYGLDAASRARRIDTLLEFFELAAHRKERMVGFSKGMKQKVALARALLHEPSVLFLDEPTSGLDPLSARAVRELIVQLKGERRSIILCTHDLDEAERLADEVAIVRRGQIVMSDAPAALRAGASSDTLVRIALAAPFPAAHAVLATISDIILSPGGPGSAPAHETLSVEYQTPHPREVNPQVLALLIARGAQVVEVCCESRTLEDIYAAAMGSTVVPPTAS